MTVAWPRTGDSPFPRHPSAWGTVRSAAQAQCNSESCGRARCTGSGVYSSALPGKVLPKLYPQAILGKYLCPQTTFRRVGPKVGRSGRGVLHEAKPANRVRRSVHRDRPERTCPAGGCRDPRNRRCCSESNVPGVHTNTLEQTDTWS